VEVEIGDFGASQGRSVGFRGIYWKWTAALHRSSREVRLVPVTKVIQHSVYFVDRARGALKGLALRAHTSVRLSPTQIRCHSSSLHPPDQERRRMPVPRLLPWWMDHPPAAALRSEPCLLRRSSL
jgi:hypothetical protein